MFDFSKIKYRRRKKIHFSLIACIVFLQLLIVITWYNEYYNESKLDGINEKVIASEGLIRSKDSARQSFYEAQNHLQGYLEKRDVNELDEYYKSFEKMSGYIDKINNSPSEEFKNIINNQFKIQSSLGNIKNEIDGLLNKHIKNESGVEGNDFFLKKFDYGDVLNSIDVETSTKVDSVKKKSFFGRLGGAIAGKTDVQKEKVDVLVKMKYGKNVSVGNIQEQIGTIFKNVNQYYHNEFLKLKKNFNALKYRDAELIATNNKLVVLSNELLKKYDGSTNTFYAKSKNDYDSQFKYNKKVKTMTIFLLVAVMIVATIILLFFTKLAFNYEKKLIHAKEQITQNLNFKNRIVGMISHEIRSPLSIISMLSRRVANKVDDPLIQNQFKTIDFTTNSLLQLSNQVLEFSKNENKKPVLNAKQFELTNELEQIANSLISLVENKGNKLVYTSKITKPIAVNSDLVKLHQLFYNIVGNANKFTNQGVIEISTAIKNETTQNVDIAITIKDNGEGIAKNDLDNIFESFYQGIISEKVNDIGAGLGLNLCKEIVELFKGTIKVESEIKKGTTVVFNVILNKE